MYNKAFVSNGDAHGAKDGDPISLSVERIRLSVERSFARDLWEWKGRARGTIISSDWLAAFLAVPQVVRTV